MRKLTGILLAGGMSRRYGSPKAFAKINDVQFYEPIYHILQSICDDVVIVARSEFINWFPTEYRVIVDVKDYQGCGPLAGIYSGMVASTAEDYLVLPCDMPLLQEDAVESLIKFHQGLVTITEVNGYFQPLVSVWNRKMKTSIQLALEEEKYALKAFLKQYDFTIVAANQLTNDPTTFLNINTAKEDEEMRKWIKS